MLTPGMALGDGRYRLDVRLALGGMGEVWRAEDTVLGRTVAIKVLQTAFLEEPGFAERFLAEARIMATLDHPGVVRVYDYGDSPAEPDSEPPRERAVYLVMQFVEGETLSKALSRVQRLTPARTMALVAQAAEALHAAHGRGIIHRDVKPGNLLVKPDGVLVLTDFGIARSAIGGQLTAVGSVLGTAAYVSPEQASGGAVTPASDIYSLGIVAYQCLTGQRPFEGENPIDVALRHVRDPAPPLSEDIPAPVRAVVERAINKDPSARWNSGAELAAAARGAEQAVVTGSTPAAPVSPAPVSPAPVSPASVNKTSVMPVVPTPPPGATPPRATPPSAAMRGTASVPRPAAPPPDEYDPDPVPTKGNGLLIGILIGGLVLCLGGVVATLIAYSAISEDKPNSQRQTTPPVTTGPAPSTEQPSSDGEIVLNESDYLGRPSGEVVLELRRKGLKPRTKENRVEGAKTGTVTSITPQRGLTRGDTVLVGVQPRKNGGGNSGGLGSFPGGELPGVNDDDDDSGAGAASPPPSASVQSRPAARFVDHNMISTATKPFSAWTLNSKDGMT